MVICFACNQPAPPTQKPVPDVNVVSVGVASVPIIKEYVGQTYGKADIAIQSRVDGWITGIHFKEGSFVKQGQLLYTPHRDTTRLSFLVIMVNAKLVLPTLFIFLGKQHQASAFLQTLNALV